MQDDSGDEALVTGPAADDSSSSFQSTHVFGSGFDDFDGSQSEDGGDSDDDVSHMMVDPLTYQPRWAKLLFSKGGMSPHLKRMVQRGFTVIRETLLCDLDTTQQCNASVVLSPTRFMAVLITCINELTVFSDLHPFLFLLEAVSPHVPAEVWRAEGARIGGFLTKLVKLYADTIALPHLLPVITHFLKAQNSAQWASTTILKLYQLVLAVAVDPSQKDRRVHQQAAQVVTAICTRAVAQRPTSSASLPSIGKCPTAMIRATHLFVKRVFEDAIEDRSRVTAAVAALSLIGHGFLQQVASSTLSQLASSITQLISSVPHGALRAQGFRTLASAFEGDNSDMQLSDSRRTILTHLLNSLLALEDEDTSQDSSLAYAHLLSVLVSILFNCSAALAWPLLSKCFARIFQLLVRSALGERLAESLIATISALISVSFRQPSLDLDVIRYLAKSIHRGLSIHNQGAWGPTLKIFGHVLQSLNLNHPPQKADQNRAAAAAATIPSVQVALALDLFTPSILRLCQWQDNNVQQQTLFPFAKTLLKVIGLAVTSLTPQKFLQLVPLEIDAEELDKQTQRRWLVSLVARNTGKNASLLYFRKSLYPLAQSLATKAEDLDGAGEPTRAQQALALSAQVWSLFPPFCIQPCEFAAGLRSIGADLLRLLAVDSPVSSLVRHCILKGLTNLASVPDLPAADQELLQQFAARVLPVLFNLLEVLDDAEMLRVSPCIRAFLGSAQGELVDRLFKVAIKKLMDAMKSSETEKGKLLMLIVMDFIPFLREPKALEMLFKLILPKLEGVVDLRAPAKEGSRKSSDNPKHAYRILAAICQHHLEFVQAHSERILQVLVQGMRVCPSSSKRPRLQALEHILKLTDEDTLVQILPEIVFCLKESNKKARVKAMAILTGIYQDKYVAEGRADRMLELMCAGLAGGPMMRSATLIGLSRLFWEGRHHFSSATMRTLLYAATELLLTHSREVLRADLDFCKVAVVSVDPAILATQLPKLLANLLSRENHDNKLHFQVAIKGVLKRLLRKFSYAELDSHIPPEDRPLLKHLHRAAKRQKRKANERKVASKPKFSGDNETAFTNLLQDSDDESPQQPDASSSASSSSAPGRRSKRSAPRHELEITGEDVDPIDILSSESYAVTSSSSSRVSSNPFQFDASGKLVISNEGSKKRGAPVSLNDDYVDPDVLDSDDDNGGEAPARATDAKRGRTVTTKETKPKRAKPANLESGDRFKNKGGGDKKVGGVDPYAYLRFDPASLNKRKKAQFGGQFKHIMHSKSKKSSRR